MSKHPKEHKEQQDNPETILDHVLIRSYERRWMESIHSINSAFA